MTDADAQTMKIILVGKAGDNIAQTIMPAVSTTLFEFAYARRHIQLIMCDQNLFRFNPEKIGQCSNGLTTTMLSDTVQIQTNTI